MNTEMMICPHCKSEIPHGANVCRGCQAEIRYGTPGLFMLAGFILPLLATSWILNALRTHSTFVMWFIGLPLTVIGWLFFYKLSQKLFSRRIHFSRTVKK
ncbi:zinc ribbon domain-containing protein [Tatumella sp. UCD-D_suzukii]|uniref:zinc ribbon domain-containing protein n=1 Tax=Tatumella sp. UCD-D_suzukii TaxID=1408192 RepID=UPI0004717912|nr:zinc ribbon domain-containing protein [Tatumella sp. UCD-D_suzukii]